MFMVSFNKRLRSTHYFFDDVTLLYCDGILWQGRYCGRVCHSLRPIGQCVTRDETREQRRQAPSGHHLVEYALKQWKDIFCAVEHASFAFQESSVLGSSRSAPHASFGSILVYLQRSGMHKNTRLVECHAWGVRPSRELHNRATLFGAKPTRCPLLIENATN
jgi:hypothetical protein